MKLTEKVQGLIDAKKYDEAITILAAIDSPKATDWIHRIEALRTVHITKSRQRVVLNMFIMFFACGASLVICSLLNS